MGDATYQETFDEEYLVEKDSEEMEGAAHSRKESAGGAQHGDSGDETGEMANPLIAVNSHHNHIHQQDV
ncbi:putative exonuclease VIII, ds DNA exonuclease encoded by prophage [Escherichia coli 7-233-03_S3_C3]|nr:putative exonuclease VIII, ds DNA exonuclease encoded by prophage [Escherichia coli 7-233-03_S3_C3]